MFLFFKVSLLLVIFGFFVSLFGFSFVVLLFEDFNVVLVFLFFEFDLSFGLILDFLLLFFVLSFLLFKNLIQLVFFFNFFNYLLFILKLILLFSFDVIVLNCLNQLIETPVICFSHFTQFAESSLLQLKLICVIFLYSLSFVFMFDL